MKYKILRQNDDNWSFNDNADLMSKFGMECDDFYLKFLLQIPNITKKDILEYFELAIFELCEFYELDMAKNDYLHSELDKNLRENSINATYASEYYGVMGQLFLGEMIDFGIEKGNLNEKGTEFDTNLSKIDLQMSLYEKWIYFRNNYFFNNKIYKSGFEQDEYEHIKHFTQDMWRHHCTWDAYTPWICITKQGKRYLNEILLPKIFNKYKDLEVEISGKSVRWYGLKNI